MLDFTLPDASGEEDLAFSCVKNEEGNVCQEEDRCCDVEEESTLVAELRQASSHANLAGVDNGTLVRSWVDGLVSSLTKAVKSMVSTNHYHSGVLDKTGTGGVSDTVRQTVNDLGDDGVRVFYSTPLCAMRLIRPATVSPC